MKDNAETVCTALPPNIWACFWEAQMQAASLKDARQMQWDPIVVQWCPNLRHLTGSAYEMLREIRTITRPSQRTRRDYTYHTKATVGFSQEVDQQLKIAAKLPSCVERDKCVFLMFDEMHIQEDLIYDKHTGW